MLWKFVLVAIVGYFIGNISFAKIISRKMLKDDISKHGSGNPGTMNMYRNYGVKIGVLTLVLDVIKGMVPSFLGFLVVGNIEGLFVAGTAAVIGHVYPVVYKFKGGKGVATTLGVFLAANPLVASIAFIGLLAFLLVFEYGGAASILSIAVIVCIEAGQFKGNYIILTCLLIIFFIVWFAHRTNILKLLTGTEGKTDLRKLFRKKAK